jgi:hypothetical protein
MYVCVLAVCLAKAFRVQVTASVALSKGAELLLPAIEKRVKEELSALAQTQRVLALWAH